MSQVDNRTVMYGGEQEWRGDIREYSTVGSFMGQHHHFFIHRIYL